jgi:GTP diphosphokinase / guanosine-3',5'-bis(diphosphate) 3'-diphosphatase
MGERSMDDDSNPHDPRTDLESLRDVLKAALFAAEKHANQRRRGARAQPYIQHPLEVALMVAQALPQRDTNLIQAALLHDCLEDAEVTYSQLEEEFGADVAALVLEVTDDKSLPKQTRKNLQVESAPRKSARAQYIRVADKISNLRSILNDPPIDWTPERQREYVRWAKAVIDRLTSPPPSLKEEFDWTYRRLMGE